MLPERLAAKGMIVLTRPALVSRRPIDNRDEELLRELFADTRDELALLPADVRYVLLDMQFRAQRRQFAANHPHGHHEILVVDGADVGRLLIDESGPVVQIVDITVHRAHRGTRIATSVLTEVVADARRSGQPVEATVWSGNSAARRTCETLGFEVASEEGGYLTMRR